MNLLHTAHTKHMLTTASPVIIRKCLVGTKLAHTFTEVSEIVRPRDQTGWHRMKNNGSVNRVENITQPAFYVVRFGDIRRWEANIPGCITQRFIPLLFSPTLNFAPQSVQSLVSGGEVASPSLASVLMAGL